MKKEINKHILLADFAKDYNAFRWIFSVFFTIIGSTCLLIFLLLFLKSLDYTNQELTWIPFFKPEKFPFEGEAMDYIGMSVLCALGLSLVFLAGVYFFKGKVAYVYYSSIDRAFITIRNGTTKKKVVVPIDQIKFLRKKRDKRSPNSISTGQHRIQTISLQNNRAFAVMKDTNEYVYLFEYYDKKKFDSTFREINKFLKENKKE